MQKDESTPVEGFTVTEMSALTPWRHAAQIKMKLKSDAATIGCVFLDVDDPSLLDFILVNENARW